MKYIDQLLLRDARYLTGVLPTIKPMVATTITSPPYWKLKNYGGIRNQIGFGQTKKQYLDDVETVLKKCLAVTKRTGSLWLVSDDYRENGVLHLLPWEIADRAKKAGWVPRELIIWDKQHSAPWQSKGQMRNVTEFILFMTKTDKYKCYTDRIKLIDEVSKWWVDFPERFNPKGKTPTNIWSFPMRTQGVWRSALSNINHHCPFPTRLVARIIEMSTDPGDLVLDPFAGSGVVLAQAAAMNRHFTGFEINPTYVDMFKKVVKKEITAEWKAMQRWRENERHAKNGFEQTILKLRALKYARQVTRPFLDKSVRTSRNSIRAVLCMAEIPNSFRRDSQFKLKISVVVDGLNQKLKSALSKSIEISSHVPLSQYGIESKIEVVKYSTLSRRKDVANVTLNLYQDYKPHQYVASGTLKELVGGQIPDSRGKLPLVANIAVDISWAVQS